MSLTSALHTTYSGLSKTEAQMSVVSSNVSNADKAGYTTKPIKAIIPLPMALLCQHPELS